MLLTGSPLITACPSPRRLSHALFLPQGPATLHPEVLLSLLRMGLNCSPGTGNGTVRLQGDAGGELPWVLLGLSGLGKTRSSAQYARTRVSLAIHRCSRRDRCRAGDPASGSEALGVGNWWCQVVVCVLRTAGKHLSSGARCCHGRLLQDLANKRGDLQRQAPVLLCVCCVSAGGREEVSHFAGRIPFGPFACVSHLVPLRVPACAPCPQPRQTQNIMCARVLS